jgi:hypothetical protein
MLDHFSASLFSIGMLMIAFSLPTGCIRTRRLEPLRRSW